MACKWVLFAVACCLVAAAQVRAWKASCQDPYYGSCYGIAHVCPPGCPRVCEVDCKLCKPICACDKPGAVCQDPRFIGGDPAGWFEWNGTFALNTLYYGEYNNRGPGAGTANRVKWAGDRVINSSSEASQFTVSKFIEGDSWLPSTGVQYASGFTGI